jgi:archaemetzincin
VIQRVLEIVPLEFFDRELLYALATEASRVFSLRCQVGVERYLPAGALDTERGQYHATRILSNLKDFDRDSFRLLGVTAVDIFTPIMRYVFGEAMLPGRAALVSTYRLAIASPQSGQPGYRSVFISRVIKEGIHELGHTFGLTHCDNPNCAMSASLDVTRIDAKSTQLCYYCTVMLKDGLNL